MSESTKWTLPVREIFGMPIAAATMGQTLDMVDEAIASRHPLHIGVVNAAKVVNMGRDPTLRDSVLASDLILADGASVVWASRILGKRLPERVAGIDLMHGMLARGTSRGYRVYCLGASREILEKTMAEIKRLYPGVILAGGRDGYFSEADESEIAREIQESKADILFVAITSPKKENFLARWEETMGVPVCHGVGGSFDVMAGKVQRAPELWQKLGLEWLYRVKQEPGRLWKRYLVTNTLFAVMVVKEALKDFDLRAQARKSRG